MTLHPVSGVSRHLVIASLSPSSLEHRPVPAPPAPVSPNASPPQILIHRPVRRGTLEDAGAEPAFPVGVQPARPWVPVWGPDGVETELTARPYVDMFDIDGRQPSHARPALARVTRIKRGSEPAEHRFSASAVGHRASPTRLLTRFGGQAYGLFYRAGRADPAGSAAMSWRINQRHALVFVGKARRTVRSPFAPTLGTRIRQCLALGHLSDGNTRGAGCR